jgi:hypothetical protein
MNDMKKIMNDWRNLLKEDMGMPQNQPEQANNSQEVNTLQNLVKQHYPEFVSGLNQLVQDKNFLNFLRKQDPNNPNNSLNIKWSSYRCSDLIPMQNIIGLDDSLAFEFKKPDKTREKASGKLIGPESYDYKSRPIITCGKYIIDGHHRWSTVYMLNPQTSIKVRDITNFRDGTSGLKASQLIIAAMKGKVPISEPKGINVFKEDMNNIIAWLNGNMTINFANVYSQAIQKKYRGMQEATGRAPILRNKNGVGGDTSTISYCVKQLEKNINLLRSNNAPQGAATTNSRTIMPQYSDDSSELEAATSGKINIKAIKGVLGAVNEVAITGQPVAGQPAQTQQQDPVVGVLNTLLATLKAKNITNYESQIKSAIQGKSAVQALSVVSNILVNVLSHKNTTVQTGQDSLKTSLTPPQAQGQPTAPTATQQAGRIPQ